MLTLPSKIDVERELCRRKFSHFVKMAWHVLEPATPLAWGWAMDAICDHLEAVTRGEIRRLLINVPPGCSKSLLLCVFWPAWEWGAKGFVSRSFLGTAHNIALAERDNRKCKQLIESDWYKARWDVQIVPDRNSKTSFENQHKGFRECKAFPSLTGSRADRLMIDDPLSAEQGNSEADLTTAERIFTESVPTRVNNSESAIVVIMQRLHERDTSGVILDRKLGYEHLCLPMRYEADRKCTTSIGFSDPREVDGELLFPERFSLEEVQETERSMGSYAAAGQLQQRPAPRDGGMFKRAWFNVVDNIPVGTTFVRGWDMAATKGGGDYTCGVLIGKTRAGRFIIADVRRVQESPNGVERLIRNTASQDGKKCKISLPQDPGQAGVAVKEYYAKVLAGYRFEITPESGSKEFRAEPLASQCEAGNVDVLRADWNEPFFNEICVFPGSKYKDQTDAATRAFSAHIRKKASMIDAFK